MMTTSDRTSLFCSTSVANLSPNFTTSFLLTRLMSAVLIRPIARKESRALFKGFERLARWDSLPPGQQQPDSSKLQSDSSETPFHPFKALLELLKPAGEPLCLPVKIEAMGDDRAEKRSCCLGKAPASPEQDAEYLIGHQQVESQRHRIGDQHEPFCETSHNTLVKSQTRRSTRSTPSTAIMGSTGPIFMAWYDATEFLCFASRNPEAFHGDTGI